MLRTILAVLLLHSLIVAQAAENQPSTPPHSSNPSTPQPNYQPYTFYDAVRRGTTEEAAIQLLSVGFITTPKSKVSGIVPLNLEFEPVEGLTVSQLHYPTTYPRKFNFQSQLVPVTGLAHIEFKVHADLNAALGPRILTAKLTFQPIQIDSGIGPVHEAVVEIPITIVDRHTSVKKTGYPYHHMPKAEEVALIVALVPLAVAVMPIYLACMASNNCPD